MASEPDQPQDGSPGGGSKPEPSAEPMPEKHDPTAEVQAATNGAVAGPPEEHSASSPPEEPVIMKPHIFVLAVTYLAALLALFVIYVTWSSFRSHVPASFGQIPVGVVWFGATGAEIASLYGIFVHNKTWYTSYNYWHYCRPMFGAVTGSIGALMYLVLLKLGSKSAITVDSLTFYAVAFVLGFADKSFMQLLQNVTNVIIKPGSSTSPVNSKESRSDGNNKLNGG